MNRNARKNEGLFHLTNRLCRLGIKITDIPFFLKIEKTLSRWHERECNEIEYIDDLPFRVIHTASGQKISHRVPNRGAAARKRLEKVMTENYPNLAAYIQTDPRGCALYLYEKNAIKAPIDSCYSSVGVAVCY